MKKIIKESLEFMLTAYVWLVLTMVPMCFYIFSESGRGWEHVLKTIKIGWIPIVAIYVFYKVIFELIDSVVYLEVDLMKAAVKGAKATNKK